MKRNAETDDETGHVERDHKRHVESHIEAVTCMILTVRDRCFGNHISREHFDVNDVTPCEPLPDGSLESSGLQYVPTIRSGSFAHIGPRISMEDEHIRIDDLTSHLGALCPSPSAFFGVFDGHGGLDAAAYIKANATEIFFKNDDFRNAISADGVLLEAIVPSIRKVFLSADLAMSKDVSKTCGTTAITALILGRLLLVANVGDCRAVLSRKGEAVEMSQDHRPIYEQERARVEKSGGYIDGKYLNGILSVSRALGDWDLKLALGAASPLIAEPEFRQILLTGDDEFLIIGCDGIWDVLSSQQAVSRVRRGLLRHDDPEKCAKDLVKKALRLNTSDNLTVVVVSFSPLNRTEASPKKQGKFGCFSLPADRLCIG
ncbi:protein-serine/threonine phosphatase [Ranunculus cassubicifolius]